MTNHAELIAEAEDSVKLLLGKLPNWNISGAEVSFVVSGLLDRLAAALRECAVPEGWEATEYTHENGNQVAGVDDEWTAKRIGKGVIRDVQGGLYTWPTASAAMAALDGGE